MPAAASLPAIATPLSESVARLLRGRVPEPGATPAAIAACLRAYDCGGWLHDLWRRSGRLDDLPAEWRAALAHAHRRTAVDNLQALAEFRLLGRHLREEGLPFIALKGTAYLVDLYDDPGLRSLTDIDLLVRRADLARLARRLSRSGYEAVRLEPESGRFEARARGREACGIEFHWWLGHPPRSRIDQEDVWRRAVPSTFEDTPFLRLAPEDAVLYHVSHQADHYYGPSLKWTIDLARMIRVWKPDPETLVERARRWRLTVALAMALRQLDRIDPGVVPDALRAVGPGPLRSRLLARFGSADALRVLEPRSGPVPRLALRTLLIDRPSDAARQALRILWRPAARLLGRGTVESPSWDRFD